MPQDNFFSRPKVRLALISGLVLIIALVIFFWWWTHRAPATVVLKTQEVVPTNNNATTVPDETTVVAPTGAELSVVSRIFVERYGSFSNQSKKQNLRDVWSMLTKSFQDRLNLTANTAVTADYSGIETRVVSISVVSQSATEAELKVKAQRSERQADLQTKTYYQDIVLSLIKSGDQWLVDRAEWK